MIIPLETGTVAAIAAEYPSFMDSPETITELVNSIVCAHISRTRTARRYLDELSPVPGLTDGRGRP